MLLELTADLAKPNRLLERCQGKHPCPPTPEVLLAKGLFLSERTEFSITKL